MRNVPQLRCYVLQMLGNPRKLLAEHNTAEAWALQQLLLRSAYRISQGLSLWGSADYQTHQYADSNSTDNFGRTLVSLLQFPSQRLHFPSRPFMIIPTCITSFCSVSRAFFTSRDKSVFSSVSYTLTNFLLHCFSFHLPPCVLTHSRVSPPPSLTHSPHLYLSTTHITLQEMIASPNMTTVAGPALKPLWTPPPSLSDQLAVCFQSWSCVTLCPSHSPVISQTHCVITSLRTSSWCPGLSLSVRRGQPASVLPSCTPCVDPIWTVGMCPTVGGGGYHSNHDDRVMLRVFGHTEGTFALHVRMCVGCSEVQRVSV